MWTRSEPKTLPATIRLSNMSPPDAPYSLDLLSRLGEAFRYETIESEELLLDGIRIRVATPAMLYRMKKDTVRPQDRLDAEQPRRLFKLEEK